MTVNLYLLTAFFCGGVVVSVAFALWCYARGYANGREAGVEEVNQALYQAHVGQWERHQDEIRQTQARLYKGPEASPFDQEHNP